MPYDSFFAKFRSNCIKPTPPLMSSLQKPKTADKPTWTTIIHDSSLLLLKLLGEPSEIWKLYNKFFLRMKIFQKKAVVFSHCPFRVLTTNTCMQLPLAILIQAKSFLR